MDNSVVLSFRRAVGKVEAVLTTVCNTTLAFLGATDDSFLWWKSVFERKILKGDVGVSIRWFHSKKIDVLWELEALVGSLSQEHQGSADKLKEIVQAAKNKSSVIQTDTEQDCNLNNYWFTQQTSNVNLNRRSTHDDLNRDNARQATSKEVYSPSRDRSSPDYFPGLNLTPRDFNQSDTCYHGGKFGSSQRSIYFNCELGHTGSADEESLRRCGSISPEDCFPLRRCASCPDVLLRGGSSVVKNCVNTFSLTPPCTPMDKRKQDISVTLDTISNNTQLNMCLKCHSLTRVAESASECENMRLNPPWTCEDESRSICKELSLHTNDLDTLASHQNALRLVWEDNLCPDMDMQNTNNTCSHYEQGQLEINRSRTEIYRDCGANTNNQDWKVQSSNVKICCSDNVFNRSHEGLCEMGIGSLDTLQKKNSNKLETITDKFPETTINADPSLKTDCLIVECSNDELNSQMNWNALNDSDTVDGSWIDRQLSKVQNINHSHPTTSVRIVHENPVQVSGLSSEVDSTHSSVVFHPPATADTKENTKSGITNFIRNMKKRAVMTLPIYDYDVSKRPLKKSKKATDLTNQDIVEETDVSDIEHSLIFDVIGQRQEEPAHATVSIKRYLGLGEVKLPEPPRFYTENEPSDVQSQSSLSRAAREPLSLIQRAGQWIASFWSVSDNEGLDRLKNEKVRMGLPEKQRYLTGRSGYMYYQLMAMTEAKYNIARLQTERKYFMNIFQWKQDTLMEVVRIAKEYYSNPTEMNLSRWKSLKKNLSKQHHSYMDVRTQVSKIPDYFPFFTAALITVQLMTLCVMCFRHGFASAGVITLSKVRTGIPTFLGTETFRHLEEPNPWLGPPVHTLLVAGAVIYSCMKPLGQLETSTVRKGYKLMTEENQNYFGCCEMESLFNIAGTTTQLECDEMSSGLGKWKMGILCSTRPTTKNSVAHVIKPCCTGYLGECRMMSHEHCIFIDGIFHSECDHCAQVNCLIRLCQLSNISYNEFILPDKSAPWLPSRNSQWQWWRLLSAIPLVYGVIHLIVLVPVQLTMMMPLEMCIGWHRLILVYISSSVVGEMVGGSFEPFVPHVGSTSGVGGVIGVAVLELFQAWNFLRCPQWEAIKLSTLILLISFLGTFYLISIVSFITGIIIGMIACLIVIPYMTYGRRLGHFRCRLVLIGLILMAITLGALQWLDQLIRDCRGCKIVECIPYEAGMCKSYYQNLEKLNN